MANNPMDSIKQGRDTDGTWIGSNEATVFLSESQAKIVDTVSKLFPQYITVKQVQQLVKTITENMASKAEVKQLANTIVNLKYAKPEQLSGLLKAFENVFASKKSLALLVNKCEKCVQDKQVATIINVLNSLTTDFEKSKIYEVDISLDGDAIRTLNSAPLSLLPFPGDGRFFEAHQSSQFLITIAAPFTIGAQKLQLIYDTGEVIWERDCSEIFNTSKLVLARPMLENVAVNKGVKLQISGSDLSDGGVSTLKGKFRYLIVDVVP